MFSFKRFTIRQDRCAMKVGTDGVLLGAWAACGKEAAEVRNVLDIGTGTGLIAIMAAQRFPNAKVIGIDIDKDAAEQAKDNVSTSPFSQSIKILHKSLQDFIKDCKSDEESVKKGFDLIVCNPPFFDNSLTCPDAKRTTARHNSTLPFPTLIKGANAVMSDDGTLAIVIPSESRQKIEDEAIFAGLTLSRRTAVVTKEGKKPKRYLLEFVKGRCDTAENVLSLESEEYSRMTADFYLSK